MISIDECVIKNSEANVVNPTIDCVAFLRKNVVQIITSIIKSILQNTNSACNLYLFLFFYLCLQKVSVFAAFIFIRTENSVNLQPFYA